MENAGSVLAEVKEMFAETSRQLAESRAEFDRQMAESRAEEDRRRAEEDRRRAEEDRRRAEEDRRRAEEKAEEDRRRAEEYDRRRLEDDRRKAEFDREMAESRAKAEREIAEERAVRAESSAKFEREMVEVRSAVAEANRAVAEFRSGIAKTNALFDKLGIGLKDARTDISGISKSNGMFAEEYFYNALRERLTFAGIHFDEADETLHGRMKRRGCPEVQDQFDIALINKEAVAIIEVKYRARMADVKLLVDRKVQNLRALYPEFKDYRVYLGLGSMVFDDGVTELAKAHGVGLLRQVGETVEEAGEWKVLAY